MNNKILKRDKIVYFLSFLSRKKIVENTNLDFPNIKYLINNPDCKSRYWQILSDYIIDNLYKDLEVPEDYFEIFYNNSNSNFQTKKLIHYKNEIIKLRLCYEYSYAKIAISINNEFDENIDSSSVYKFLKKLIASFKNDKEKTIFNYQLKSEEINLLEKT